ncbi:MAG: winged helix-turn-helix domain-containing protein [Psychrobium sp.]
MSETTNKGASLNLESFTLGAWIVTPPLNTLTLSSDKDVVRKLTPKVMSLCEFLVQHHGEPKSQEEIAQTIWPERIISDSSIYQAIAQLRKALQHESNPIEYVERVSGKGYRIHAPFEIIASSLSSPANTEATSGSSNSQTNDKNGISKLWHYILTSVVVITLIALLIKISYQPPAGQAYSDALKIITILPTDSLNANGQDSDINHAYAQFGQLLLNDLVSDNNHKFVYLRTSNEVDSTAPQLTSSIHQSNEKLVLTMHLRSPVTNDILWEQRITSNNDDLFELKNSAATSLLNFLNPQTSNRPIERTVTRHDPHFEDYALAHYLWNKRQPQALRQAQTIYSEILRQSPHHLGALIGQCHTQIYLSIYSDLSPQSAHKLCLPFVDVAGRIAPNNAEVLATQALLKLYDENRDDQVVESLFKRAIEVAPNYVMAHHWYGNFLRETGQYHRGLQQHRLAYSLDPLSPIVIRGLAYAHLNLRQLEHARRYYDRALTIEPFYAHRAAEELDFFLLNTERARAFIHWLEKPSNIADKPTYQLTQALVWLGLGNIETAKNMINQAEKHPVNQAFLLYCQGALASAQGDFNLAQQKMTERLNLTPNITRYAMPHITALFYNNKPAQALKAQQHYFPTISLSGTITDENSGQFILLARIYEQLNDATAHQKIINKLTQFHNEGGEFSAQNDIYWRFITKQYPQAVSAINKLLDEGWLPDFNDNVFVHHQFEAIYLQSGGSEQVWRQKLASNRQINEYFKE